MRVSWEETAKSIRDYRDASLAKVQPPISLLEEDLPSSSQSLPKELLSAQEFDLTSSYTSTQLLEQLRKRTLTAGELACAFLRRAAIAHSATNCLTELMWDEAIERARYLDSLPEPLGPLHGLPISVKEHQGMHLYSKKLNCSYTAWSEQPSPFSPLNQILWDAGCIFYARTNQPQTLQCIETNNNIYGRTVNPWNRNLSSGGSSGGEGALIGMRGSLLGIGGDIGGSVRVPAGNNGLYGFKPTAKRLGVVGMSASMAGNEGIQATTGPISTDRESIELFMKVVLGGQPWRMDPSLDNKLWQPIEITKPLKVAIMWSDGVVKPHPPIERALKYVVQQCSRFGMELVDWMPLDYGEMWDLYVSLLYPDGGVDTLKPLIEAGEPILPLIQWITEEQPAARERSITEYWKLVTERENYRADHAAHWNKTAASDGKEVDVILCPVGPGVASLHNTARYWTYTSIWNLLDYPAVVFPTGLFVDPPLDNKAERYCLVNKQDEYNHSLWVAEKFAGAPISLQLVARRGMDEFVMAALKEMEVALGTS